MHTLESFTGQPLNITPERVSMSQRYHKASRSSTTCDRIVTNDLFLASFLHCLGCTLSSVECNERRRVSFVFTGERVKKLREAYRTGTVSLDINAFRESMHLMRSQMDLTLSNTSGNPSLSTIPYQRSSYHARTGLTTQPQC